MLYAKKYMMGKILVIVFPVLAITFEAWTN